MLAAQADGGTTPGQVTMTPYDSNSPMRAQDVSSKSGAAAFSPGAVNDGDDAPYSYGNRPVGSHGAISPAAAEYSRSSPNAYSPASPCLARSPSGGGTSPLGHFAAICNIAIRLASITGSR